MASSVDTFNKKKKKKNLFHHVIVLEGLINLADLKAAHMPIVNIKL